MTIRRLLGIAGVIVACGGPLGAGQQPRDPEVLFQSALYKEQVELNLQDAIAGYREVVAASAGNKTIAAKALLQMAGCFERMGRPEAVATYQRILADYTDSGPVASAARTKLAAIDQKGRGLIFEQVWDRSGRFISSDGRYVSFTDWNTGNLALHDLTTGRDRLLTTDGTPGGSWGQFAVPSRDGRMYAYHWANAENRNFEIRIISRDGGRPRTIYRNAEPRRTVKEPWGPWGWTPDGNWVLTHFLTAVPGGSEIRDLAFVSIEGKPTRFIKRFERIGTGILQPGWFDLSPDGRYAAYERANSPGVESTRVFVVSTESGEETELSTSPGDRFLAWFPASNRVLIASQRGGSPGLWAINLAAGRPHGDPEAIREKVEVGLGLGFSRAGDFYYRVASDSARNTEVYLATIDPSTSRVAGAMARLGAAVVGNKSSAVWSPDGQRLAYVPTAGNAITIRTMSGGDERTLAVSLTGVNSLAWMPDGHRMLVYGRAVGQRMAFHVFDVRTGGLTQPNPALSGASRAVAPNGRVYRIENNQIVSQDLTTGIVTSVPAPVGPNVANAAVSPDGKWFAFRRRTVKPMGSEFSLHVVSATGTDMKSLSPALSAWKIGSGDAMAWTADGNAILIARQVLPEKPRIGELERSVVWRVPVDGSAPTETGISWEGNITQLSVHPDGRTLAISTTRGESSTWVLRNIPGVK